MVLTSRLCALQNETDAYRKVRLRVEEVSNRNCLTQFWVSLASLCPTQACCIYACKLQLPPDGVQ